MLFNNKPSTDIYVIKVAEGNGEGSLWFKQVQNEAGNAFLDLQSGRDNAILLFGKELAEACRAMVESQIEKGEGEVVDVSIEHVGTLALFERVIERGKMGVPDSGGRVADAPLMLAATSSISDGQ